jgi:hypothetical protein
MRGTGPVGVNGTIVYAYFVLASGSVRVRVSVDEADRLGLVDGLKVQIALPGRQSMELLVMAAKQTPPYVWLHMEPLTPSSLNTTGSGE